MGLSCWATGEEGKLRPQATQWAGLDGKGSSLFLRRGIGGGAWMKGGTGRGGGERGYKDVN